jgi:hypothetical protein
MRTKNGVSGFETTAQPVFSFSNFSFGQQDKAQFMNCRRGIRTFICLAERYESSALLQGTLARS